MRPKGIKDEQEPWSDVLESKGFKMIWTITEYMMNEEVVKFDVQEIP